MFCDACNKLVILKTNKVCMKCKGAVFINIAVICDTCSNNCKCCAACLKKIFIGLTNPNYKNLTAGCKSCGR